MPIIYFNKIIWEENMKKGYIRLLVFEFFVCIILFLNSFVWNILSRHIMNAFLFLLLFIFRMVFGFEKDRHRYIKDILMDVFIFLMVFFILYYLFGIVITFAKSGNYYTFNGVKDFIVPIFVFVIFKEYLRYNLLMKAEGNLLTVIVGIIMFIWIDVSSAIFYGQFNSSYNIFVFFALTVLPSISNNVVFSYITFKVGYKPVILYSLVMSLYYYLLPIVPNPNEYLMSVINLLLPVLLFYRIYLFLKKSRDEEVDRFYKKKHFGWLILSVAITVILVYFTSGYFSFWAIAVASGSMSPAINKGDVVVIHKINDDGYGNIEKGDVLAFQYDNVTIVHRVVNVVQDNGKYYFYTKGDANNHEDNFTIEKEMVIGKVSIRIPWLGIPTVWLNEL